MIVMMIFVTQNNLKRSRNFQPSPWILPTATKIHFVQSLYLLLYIIKTLYSNSYTVGCICLAFLCQMY